MTSLYIHLPFCKKKCNYCDFVSYPGKEGLIDDYVEALCKEISGTRLVPSGVEGDEIRGTIFFGGGTPTLLEPKHFNKIFSHITSPISDIEVSIEANPGTADKSKLKELRKLGINRLSIGAQSFNDQHLKTLGRIHNSYEILKFYEDARSAGFDNINLDLIFALPGQSLKDWKKDLKVAIALSPNHISAYSLKIEEGTPFYQDTNIKKQVPSEDIELAMYEYTIVTLWMTGFKHYEISNFAKTNFECQHNINYWKNGNYIGIGAGAHSHINGKRWANPNSIEEYIANPGTRLAPGGVEGDDSSLENSNRDTLFLGLRMLEGLPVEKFKGFESEVEELIKDGLLKLENDNYKLTRQGLYLGNEVFAKFV